MEQCSYSKIVKELRKVGIYVQVEVNNRVRLWTDSGVTEFDDEDDLVKVLQVAWDLVRAWIYKGRWLK